MINDGNLQSAHTRKLEGDCLEIQFKRKGFRIAMVVEEV